MKQQQIQNVVVMGLGYIGLPTASMLATKGHKVLGVDVDPDTIKTVNQGSIHIVEPDLDLMVRSAVHGGNLRASLEPDEADTFILAVPTPFRDNGVNKKTPDLSCVESATKAICPVLQEGNLIILESTSPVGATERVAQLISDNRPDLKEVYVAHCPERVLPGHILRELVDNDRIIGGVDRQSAEKAKNLYQTFCNGEILLTDARTAEMAKLVENSYRDVNIAFANELSLICDKLDINVWELISLANRHPRVSILQPGPGVGGHCIAVDPWFIVDTAPEEAKLIKTAREVNDHKPEWVLEKVRVKAERFKQPVIGCLGLAFKANIDDLRESPALDITRALIRQGVGEVIACEPNLNGSFDELPLYNLGEVLKRADILVVLVDHQEFKEVDASFLNEKIVIDTRGIWK
jgi:UDP-N-acetyl-D-mannosaminuronic acid dehydrogenase